MGITVQAIPHNKNEAADELDKMASSVQPPPANVFYKVLKTPSAPAQAPGVGPEVQGVGPKVLIIGDVDWRELIFNYLAGREEPEELAEAKRLQQRARNYSVINGILYKGGVCTLLRFISRQEGQDLLREIHQGLYGAHQAPRSLAARALRQDLNCSTTLCDAHNLVQKCQGCKWMGCSTKAPPTPLQPIPPVWPFAR